MAKNIFIPEKGRGDTLPKTSVPRQAKGAAQTPPPKTTKAAPPRGRTEEGFICQIQLLPGRTFSALLGLNSMWNQTSGAIKWVDRFKFCSSDQLCAPSVKLYVGLSSLSEIFLASRGMKFVISSVPPDMRFSRSRISALRGQPAFPACLCHLGHMVIGVALADSISAS